MPGAFASPRAAAFLALAAVAFVFAWPMQGTGFNQNSHYVLVKALAKGTPTIESSLDEIGELSTQDVTRYRGRVYSNKAPGLAFLTLPPYLVLDAVGVRMTGDPTQMLWALGLIGNVLPALLLLVLVSRVANAVEPGFGIVAAVALGLGTLLTPFATLFFSHALAALAVFGAFYLLWRERRGAAPRLWLVVAAGLVAGLSVVVEYPNALAAAVFGLYAISRRPAVRRGLAYTAGVAVGVLPLLLYNAWAFSDATHLSYRTEGDENVPAAPTTGDLVGDGRFDVAKLMETLVGAQGLLTLTPVLLLGAIGTVVLFRRGFRAEALVAAGVSALFLVYNSSYGSNFGGFSPGHRYVIPMIPLLALGLATAFRAWPLTTAALGAVSGIVMVTMTATHALAGYDLDWFARVGARDFVYTPAWLVGVTGWYTILPFLAAAIAAAVFAALSLPPLRVRPLEPLVAGAALLGWAIVAAGAPKTTALAGRADELGAYGAAAGVAVVGTIAVLAARAVFGPGRAQPTRA